MEEITIVRKRSRLWPVLLTILLLAVVIFVVLWLMGNERIANVVSNGIIEFGRRSISGTA
jgi:hypothetical protein